MGGGEMVVKIYGLVCVVLLFKDGFGGEPFIALLVFLFMGFDDCEPLVGLAIIDSFDFTTSK